MVKLVHVIKERIHVDTLYDIKDIKEQKKMLPWLRVYGTAMAVGKVGLALRQCMGTQESSESSWLGKGDIES